MQSLQTLLTGSSNSTSRCHLCQNRLRQPSSRLSATGPTPGSATAATSPAPSRTRTQAEKFFDTFMAEYNLQMWQRRQILKRRAVWAVFATGSAYGLCRVWETHQSKKADPNSLHLPMLGSQVNLQRWTLVGPCAVALVGSSCVFGLWRMRTATSLSGVTFLRLFVDRPGLGKPGLEFSRPLLSPLFSAFSHRTWGHFVINQLVLLGAVSCCIGKLSPGEFVAFAVASAYATSLASLLAMSATKRFACRYGASGVLSALVAFNALTDDETRRVWRGYSPGSGDGKGEGEGEGEGESEGSSLALFGVIPLPWISPPVGVAVWAACEAACLAYATLWRKRVPRVNHATHLAGIAFGSLYAWRGHQLLWSDRPVPKLKYPLPPGHQG